MEVLITAAQLADGYHELVPYAGEGPDEPVKTIRRDYVVLQKRSDGNYVVESPYNRAQERKEVTNET